MKVSGGLVEITLTPSARAKFFLISPELVRLAEEANGMAGVLTKLQHQNYNLTAAMLSREENKHQQADDHNNYIYCKLHQSLYSVRRFSFISFLKL